MPAAAARLQDAQHALHRVLTQHVDAVLGIEPCLATLRFGRLGHPCVNSPELYRSTLLENKILAVSFEETVPAGRFFDQLTHVDNRIRGMPVRPGHQYEPVIRSGSRRIRIGLNNTRWRPGKIRKSNRIDAAVTLLIRPVAVRNAHL